ncbi:MAG: tRNA (N6-isopentenyl adenosine(37)-C2)-methylthiotransferase MiaB [Candidatus Omnitrophota bacterium]
MPSFSKQKGYKNNSLKVYIRTFGCQMNVRDSEVIAGLLTKEGFRLASDESEADVVVYNTCSVRKHAEDKVWSELGKFKVKGPSQSLRANPARKKIIGVIGCMAQYYKDEVFRRAPQVDFVVGPSDIAGIPQIIEKIMNARRNATEGSPERSRRTRGALLFESKIWETEGSIRPEEIYHTGFYEEKNHAYVVISEGCSNYCCYCVVPFVRGELKNRNHRDIIREIEEAVNKGITNITLLGQNVNAYQYDSADFVRLLELVNNVRGLERFSFITSHPKDVPAGLFKAMAGLEKIKKYLHLPVQSGSDRMLRLMNRGYTRGFYRDLIRDYRNAVKGGVLTTDVIVGFPGETEEDFQDTYNLVKEAEFDSAYIFKYSPRPHTKAEGLPDDVPRKEKERRHGLVLNLQKEISRRKRLND